MEEVARACAAWLQERGASKSFSKEYMRQLRSGKAANPTKSHLEALAAFFDVDPVIFFDTERSRRIEADLELVAALRDAQVRTLALRALGLTAADRAQVLELISSLHTRRMTDASQDEVDNPSSKATT